MYDITYSMYKAPEDNSLASYCNYIIQLLSEADHPTKLPYQRRDDFIIAKKVVSDHLAMIADIHFCSSDLYASELISHAIFHHSTWTISSTRIQKRRSATILAHGHPFYAERQNMMKIRFLFATS